MNKMRVTSVKACWTVVAAACALLFILATMPKRAALADAPAAPQRQPTPDSASQAKKQKLIHNVFGNFDAAPVADRAALAPKLIDQGVATADDPVARYVLIKDGGELAASVGDAATAMRASTLLASMYAVDDGELKLSLLRRAGSAANTPELASGVAQEELKCINEAAAAGNYDLANRYVPHAEQMARFAKDLTLVLAIQSRSADIKWLQSETSRAKIALDKLNKSPTDAEANFTLGRHYCLVRGDWAHGMVGLSKGSNAAYRAAATADLANPTATDKQIAAGDSWWAIAEKESSPIAQRSLRQRAGYWYRQALANQQLAGLSRTIVEKRLSQVPADPDSVVATAPQPAGVPAPSPAAPPGPVPAPAPAPAPANIPPLVERMNGGNVVNLLRMIDLSKDIVAGKWAGEPSGITSAMENGQRIRIPFDPPAEYDLRITVTVHSDGGYIGLLPAHGEATFLWLMKPAEGASAFEGGAIPNNGAKVRMERFAVGSKHEAILSVREHSVKTYIDGKLANQFTPDYPNMQAGDYWSVGRHFLGIATHHCAVTFNAIELAEGSRHGKAMARPDGPKNPAGAPASAPPIAAMPSPATPLPEIKFVRIEPGEFMMGSPPSEPAHEANEALHRVKITRPFLMATTSVTQAQWRAVMGTDPANFKGDDRPVEQVSWDDAVAFCKRVSVRLGRNCRLPTEAEWEYASRAGTTTSFYTGEGDAALNEAAWYRNNSEAQTHPVGQKKPNPWGLYDMLGNVNQWCSDYYGDYPAGEASDPTGPQTGTKRVYRGGQWRSPTNICRAARRSSDDPNARIFHTGFRICADVTATGGTPPAGALPPGGNIFSDDSKSTKK